MQAFGQPATRHGAPGVLIDKHHLIVLYDVFHIPMEQRTSAQGGVDVVQQPQIVRGIEALSLRQQSGTGQQVFHFLVSLLGQLNLAAFFIDRVIAILTLFRHRIQVLNQLAHAHIQLGAVLCRTGDDERGTRLVNQDRIHFVHHGEVERPLDFILQTEGHVIAQIIKAELVVGAVGYIRRVSVALVGGGLHGADDAHGHAQLLVDLAHPGGVSGCQVIVHRDHVDATAGQGVQVTG